MFKVGLSALYHDFVIKNIPFCCMITASEPPLLSLNLALTSPGLPHLGERGRGDPLLKVEDKIGTVSETQSALHEHRPPKPKPSGPRAEERYRTQ